MPWGQASIRGVPFFSRVTEVTVGQRRAVYEFPFDSKGAAGYDLGRRARRYQVEGLLYPDQADDYDRLVAALEAPGPALFQHPTRGAVMVEIAPEITLTEHQDNMLGDEPIVEFTFQATESRDRVPAPVATEDAKSAVQEATAEVRATASAAMVERTRLEGVSDIIREAHLESLDIVLSDITLLNGVISAALSIPGVFASQIDSIANQVVELIDTPDVLFAAMDGALTSIISSVNKVEEAGVDAFVRDVTSPGAQINAIASLITATAASSSLGEAAIDSTGTDTRSITAAVSDIERDNANVTLRGIRAAAICACAEAATEAVFPSHQEALDALAAIVAAIDALAEQPINRKECPDELYVSLQDLRARLSKGINAQELVDLVDFYPGEASDAAVIAYALYGDATRAEEIAERAHAIHPSFIPGATLIRVLEK